MKKFAIAAITATSLLTLGACSNSGGNSSDVVAETKYGNITKDELYKAMKTRDGEIMLRELVDRKVLGEKYKVTDKEINAELDKIKSQAGAQYDMIVQQQGGEAAVKDLVKTQLLRQKAVSSQPVTDADVKKYYDTLKGKVHAAHILVQDEKTAKEVEAKLKSGSKFEDLAKSYSKDSTAQAGGDLGWFGKGQMVKEFEDAAFKLKEGQVSQPVKSEYGYHIIKVLQTVKPYDQMKDSLKADVKKQKEQDAAAIQTVVDKALKDAKVKVKDEDLKDTFKKPDPSQQTPEAPAEQPAQ
ncbi:peptidylprolyl isomerase [Metabacillus sp. GX 13764]|uniref:peptidylprolyl isomerase n=1 Tax=Metabacillus kandeliae TaxID=2900151 RepID=UPI001E2F6E65|nr:peptidylprolyl isomerase [Metabacillus kandeliae]MCD7034850.1 peptidylprolyl isomerase [Metabacillus kandeliae]